MTRTEPSSVSSTELKSSSSMVVAEEEDDDGLARASPVARQDEPNLYDIPSGLYPTYRPFPGWLCGIFTYQIASATTWKGGTWLSPLIDIRQGKLWRIVQVLLKTMVLSMISSIVIEDVFLRPSRISTSTLLDRYYLPSVLSRFKSVSLPDGSGDIGVHYLHYENARLQKKPAFQALYLNHGFGASSLSWLPALPKLVDRLQARRGLAHDAAGFGFTDRPPDDLDRYTSQASADIGLGVLNAVPLTARNSSAAVALFGHSMGAISTLHMALGLPRETRKFIVLVGPALGIRGPVKKRRGRNMLLSRVKKIWRKIFVEPVIFYILRRVVGAKQFWRRGLRLAWGDPEKLTDSDVLRFQWPSIGMGWERGLWDFSRAQVSVERELTDTELMQRVLDLPNTTVCAIVGSKDSVVPAKSVKKFLEAFPQVELVELEGLGHDPFEEDVDSFTSAVAKLAEASSLSLEG